jgi:hypothetical protein
VNKHKRPSLSAVMRPGNAVTAPVAVAAVSPVASVTPVTSAAAEPLASTDASASSPPFSAATPTAAPAAPAAPAASAVPAASAAPSTASYGLRAKGYKQINVLVQPDVLRSLKVRLAEEDRELSEVSTLLYKAWLDGRITI